MTSCEDESALPPEHFSARIEGGTQVFLAEGDGDVVLLRIEGGEGSIHGLYVHPGAGGRGRVRLGLSWDDRTMATIIA